MDTMTKPDLNEFGARLAVVRWKAGALNVTKAAEMAGLPPSNWREWENGRLPKDYFDVCRAISVAFGVDLDWLMRGPGELPRPDSDREPAGYWSLKVA